MDPVTIAAVAQVINSDRWETIRDLLRRGDRPGASAEVDDVIDTIDADRVGRLDGQTKADVRY
jgi:hypothetical protein